MDNIVVGIDGSDHARKAVEWAYEEAKAHNATLHVVMAWHWGDQRHADGSSFDPAYDETDAARVLKHLLDEALGDADRDQVEEHPVLDLPARALIEAGADADLLVVGRRGLGGFKGLLLGSVSQQVISHAPCPVTLIP